jgi:hypothetical protein
MEPIVQTFAHQRNRLGSYLGIVNVGQHAFKNGLMLLVELAQVGFRIR